MTDFPPILIAGGGIGGLAAALALAKLGRRSIVIERATGPVAAGAGIQLGSNAVKALRRLGVAEAVAAVASVPDALVIRQGVDGSVLTRMPLGATIARRYGAPYWVVHRADLHRVLAEAATAQSCITMMTGCSVATISSDGDRVALVCDDGTRIEGSAVVGADGLWSRVRAAVAPQAVTEPSGFCAYRALIPVGQAGILSESVVGAWLSPKAHVVHYPVRNGQAINVVVIVRNAWTSEAWGMPAHARDVHDATAGFARSLGNVLGVASSWHQWSLAKPLVLPVWCHGLVTVLGDAAHPMLPFFAQGGAMALEDAVCLGVSVARHPSDLRRAFADYAASRQDRTARVQAASTRNGAIFHLAGPWALARNAALQLLPPAAQLARLDWLYGYEVTPS